MSNIMKTTAEFKKTIKLLCREIAKIDMECERLAKEKLELQLEMARIAAKEVE